MIDLTRIGRALLWYSIVFSIFVFIISVIFVSCGYPPPYTYVLGATGIPLFEKFYSTIMSYFQGHATPVSMSSLIFGAVLLNTLVAFAIPFSTLIPAIVNTLGAPLPIVYASAVLGVVLDMFKMLYVLGVIIGRMPI